MSAYPSMLWLILIFTISTAVSAQQVMRSPMNPLAPENTELIREKFINSANLPDGVAFHEILLILEHTAPDDRRFAVALVGQEMKLAKPEAEKMLDLLLNSFQTLQLDIDEAHLALGCNGEIAAAYGDDVYRAFEAMDDKTYELAQIHLDALADSLPHADAARLHKWVATKKLSMSHVKFKHKAAYERSGKSADAVLAAICANLHSRTIGAGN